MRPIGQSHPTDSIPLPPDTVVTIATTALTAAAADWPAGTQIARLSAVTTSDNPLPFTVNLFSTGVVTPTAGTSSNSTAGVSHLIQTQGSFQIPANSTGFSVITLLTGYVYAECWRK